MIGNALFETRFQRRVFQHTGGALGLLSAFSPRRYRLTASLRGLLATANFSHVYFSLFLILSFYFSFFFFFYSFLPLAIGRLLGRVDPCAQRRGVTERW